MNKDGESAMIPRFTLKPNDPRRSPFFDDVRGPTALEERRDSSLMGTVPGRARVPSSSCNQAETKPNSARPTMSLDLVPSLNQKKARREAPPPGRCV